MTKETKKNAVMAALFAAGLISGFLIKWLGPLPVAVHIAWMAAVLALAIGLGFYCWSLLDEAQKEAHKWAWYWGGSTGLLVGCIVMVLVSRIDPHLVELIRPNASPRAYAELGFSAAALSTLAGYGVAWAAWWITRR